MTDVNPGTFGMFAFDNNNAKHRGVCGAISWQINNPDGSPVKDRNLARRLVITYHVKFK